jgi:hypothetical protein
MELQQEVQAEAPKKMGRPRKVKIEEVKPTDQVHKSVSESSGIQEKMSQSAGEQTRAKLRSIMDDEKRMVTGKFIYHECPGGTVAVFQRKYKELPAFKETFVDGNTYTVPMWVARFLNGYDKSSASYGNMIQSGAYPRYQHETQSKTNSVAGLQSVGEWKRRFSFQSMDFIS